MGAPRRSLLHKVFQVVSKYKHAFPASQRRQPGYLARTLSQHDARTRRTGLACPPTDRGGAVAGRSVGWLGARTPDPPEEQGATCPASEGGPIARLLAAAVAVVARTAKAGHRVAFRSGQHVCRRDRHLVYPWSSRRPILGIITEALGPER